MAVLRTWCRSVPEQWAASKCCTLRRALACFCLSSCTSSSSPAVYHQHGIHLPLVSVSEIRVHASIIHDPCIMRRSAQRSGSALALCPSPIHHLRRLPLPGGALVYPLVSTKVTCRDTASLACVQVRAAAAGARTHGWMSCRIVLFDWIHRPGHHHGPPASCWGDFGVVKKEEWVPSA